MNQPKISVIVPVYNVEQYLVRCLESLFNQTLKDIEIICVNDGSTDKSKEILLEYSQKDERIVVIEQENKGVSIARNYAIPLAKGEYIGFVDSDDYVDLDFYEKLYVNAKKYNAEIACASAYRVRENKRNKYYLEITENKVYKTTKQKYSALELSKNCFIWNKIYKTESFLKSQVEFEPDVYFEDILFTHKILHFMKDMVCVQDVKYYYCENMASIVGTSSEKKDSDFANAIQKSMDFIRYQKIKYNNWRFYPPICEMKFNLLGIPILKIKTWQDRKNYYLFHKILIIAKTYKREFS